MIKSREYYKKLDKLRYLLWREKELIDNQIQLEIDLINDEFIELFNVAFEQQQNACERT